MGCNIKRTGRALDEEGIEMNAWRRSKGEKVVILETRRWEEWMGYKVSRWNMSIGLMR